MLLNTAMLIDSYIKIEICKKTMRYTKKTISMIRLWKMYCHAGLSSIFLQEGFQTSWNDNQCGLIYDRISIRRMQ